MTIEENELKLAHLAFQCLELEPGDPMPEELLKAWQRTLRLTDLNLKTLAQFANNAALHSHEHKRIKELNVRLGEEIQKKEELILELRAELIEEKAESDE